MRVRAQQLGALHRRMEMRTAALMRPNPRMIDLSAAEGKPDPQECRIQAMDRSPDGKMLIVGGQNMLRLVKLEDGCVLANGRNVRSTKHKAQHYAVSDLKFHPHDDLVASCSSNASVVLWHLARLGGGAHDGKMAEHKAKEHGGHQRTVHSLSWLPEEGTQVLLTCSQDATMKLWDLRVQQCVRTTFTGRHGAAVPVRSVQFHPGGYPTLFLAGLENGQVQVWDTRRTQEHVCASLPRSCVCGSSRRPEPWAGWKNDSDISLQNAKNKFVKMQAHDQHVFSVQWHPTEKDWFASSGRDGMVHCWDLSKDIRNPVKSIKNMDFKSAVSRVAWRPGYESCLATCGGGLNDYKIHVWDADRPFMPLCFFKAGLPPERAKASASKTNIVNGEAAKSEPEQHDQGYDSTGHTDDVTGLLWLDEDRLASCSKDGTVRIHEVDEGYRPYRGISTVTPAWSSLGDVAVAGAPIVRDWIPKRDQAWLKAERRRVKRVERQESGERGRHRRRGSDSTAALARRSERGEEKALDERGSASDRFRRGIQNVIGGATRDLKQASLGAAGRAVSNDSVDSGHSDGHEVNAAESNNLPALKSLKHWATAGAPPLDPATTAVQIQSLSALGGIGDDGTAGKTSTGSGDSESDAVAAASTEPAAEELPEGGWTEQPYNLGYNTGLFEYLAKHYAMTPIFSASPTSATGSSSPSHLKTRGSAGAAVGTATAEAESGGNPRSANGTPRSSPISTAEDVAPAPAPTTPVSAQASAVSNLARPRQASSGSGSSPPASPRRLAASNVDSITGSDASGNGNADVASRQKISLMLGRLDRNAARGLGLTVAAVAAAVDKSTTEAELRAQHCLRLGDTAVRDEDELGKAVRWYLAGIAAIKGSNATSSGGSAGGGWTHTPLLTPGGKPTHGTATMKVSVTELLAAQLDKRLIWARRRHCDGVAAGVRHNAAVALRAGQRELANCWQMLQALVTRDSENDEDKTQDANEDEKNGNDGIFRKRYSEPTSPMGSDNGVAAAAAAAATAAAAAAAAGDAAAAAAATDRTGLLDGLFGSSVARLATWFAERRGEADLQSAVTLLLLVGRPYMWSAADAIVDLWPPHDPSEDSQGTEETVGPPPPHQSQVWRQSNRAQAEQQDKVQQQPRALIWCHAYIELLQRHKLDTLAIRVAHLSQCGVIQKLNQERVHFKAVAKCLSCDTELPPAPVSVAKEAGSHCNNPACVISQSLKLGALGVTGNGALGYVNARCGVCRLPVRGPWVWCQGCGHGGHLACYENWFAHQRLCPTGCNHLCNMVGDGLDLDQD